MRSGGPAVIRLHNVPPPLAFCFCDSVFESTVDLQGTYRDNEGLMSFHVNQGGPPWPSDAISIESNGISNRSNRNSQKFSNGRKIARMARILTIFGRNRSSRRNLSFQKFSNERKIIESIESTDWISRSIDRIDRWPPWSGGWAVGPGSQKSGSRSWFWIRVVAQGCCMQFLTN